LLNLDVQHPSTVFAMTSVAYIVCGGELILLGLANVCAFVPTIVRVFILKNVESLHQDPVSDIPGNPHAFSPAIISLFRTLPEPSNFNVVWTGLTLSEPLLIKGDIPLSRFSSLSVYGAGSADPPNSVELNAETDHKRSFGIVLAPEGAKDFTIPDGAVVVRSNNWKKGFVAMRNYLVPPGCRVLTPEVVRLQDGAVVRPASALVSGPSGLDLRPSAWAQSALRALKINAAVLALNILIFDSILSLPFLLTIVVGGGLLGYALYFACFLIGRKRLTQLTKDICQSQNAFFFASLEQGSKASQPSKLHKYWMMRHNVPLGSEITVTVKVNPAFQKYWSLVVYDEYGLPLPQYVYDANCLHMPTDGANTAHKARSGDAATRSSGVYEVDIRLRNGGRGAAHRRDAAHVNVVDVAACAKGYVLFRVNHPVGEHVVEFSTPVATWSKM
jgi:hypothetical protein